MRHNKQSSSGSRLVVTHAKAEDIDTMGRVRFSSPDLPNGSIWVDSGYRPGGVTKGDILSIYYDWTPSRGYYVARQLGFDYSTDQNKGIVGA